MLVCDVLWLVCVFVRCVCVVNVCLCACVCVSTEGKVDGDSSVSGRLV